jgi:hypothetical protein
MTGDVAEEWAKDFEPVPQEFGLRVVMKTNLFTSMARNSEDTTGVLRL